MRDPKTFPTLSEREIDILFNDNEMHSFYTGPEVDWDKIIQELSEEEKKSGLFKDDNDKTLTPEQLPILVEEEEEEEEVDSNNDELDQDVDLMEIHIDIDLSAILTSPSQS